MTSHSHRRSVRKTTSSQPRKQRLARLHAPHHQARKQIASHLSEELLLRFNRRSATVIAGDEVRLLRGDHKGTSGKILEVRVGDRKVVVEGVTNKKADGTEVPLPVDPSNLVITRLNLEDPRREARLQQAADAQKGEPKTQKASKASGKGGKAAAPKKSAKKEA